MKRLVPLLFLSLSLLLAGCSSNPIRDGVDVEKAAQANANLGLRYMMQGDYEVAMKKLNRALEYDPDHVPSNHYLAELYRRLGRNEDAEEHYEHALRYAKGDASSLHNNYGVFLCGLDRFDDGIEQLEKVLDNPVYARRDQVYENLGLCTERKGEDMEKAEEYLRKGLQLNPNMPKSLLAMARLTFAKKNYLSTRAYLQRYGNVARHTPESLWLGIQVERVLGDKNALASYGLSLKGNFPDAPETKLYLQSK
jgi:type IV pilus assembly protein PilF